MPFLPFVYGYPSFSPRAHCTPNKSVPTLSYTRRHGPIYIYIYRSMPEGSYRVQSPGFPKIVYWCSYWTSWCHPFTWRAVVYRTVFARDVSPTVTLTWHARKYKVHKLHLRYILFVVFVIRISTLINSLVCCYNQFPLVDWLDINIFLISEWYILEISFFTYSCILPISSLEL